VPKWLKNKATKYFIEVLLGLVAFVILQYFYFGDGVESERIALDESTDDVVEVLSSPAPELRESTTSSQIALPAASEAAEVSEQLQETEAAVVTRVVDGDTLKVELAGKSETVRIVGMNTPETVDPRKPVECFGKEASDKMSELVGEKVVRLEQDSTQGNRDRYNRLLRFVFLEDGRDVGLELIREGFAEESLYGNVPHKYREEYLEAEREAQSASRGLWNPAACPVN
jgi:micrococcal nuclease